MIKYFILIMLFQDGEVKALRVYDDLKSCELRRAVHEHEKSKIVDKYLCKQVEVDLSGDIKNG
ncbi:MAG: hypothetical protein K0U20_09580 [Proteobacteria bacterium]|nr:hypothetical protein [Pseudomonadota bacterium]MCH9735836.1 hypothetical protein [Actinomycetes bacterium]